MNRSRFAASAVLLALIGATRAVGEEGDLVLVDVPMARDTSAPGVAFGVPRLGEVESATHADSERSLEGEFWQMVGPEVEALGGEYVPVSGSQIGVRGPAPAVELMRKRAEELQLALDGRVVLDVSLVRVAPDAALLRSGARDDLRAALGDGSAVLVIGERLTLRRGETVTRDEVETRTIASRLEGAVAEYAGVTAPATRPLTTGRRLAARARSLPGDLVVVDVSMQISGLQEPLRRERTSAGEIDLPQVRFVALAAPFALRAGETGRAVVPDPDGNGVLVLHVTLVEADAVVVGRRGLLDFDALVGDHVATAWFQAPGRAEGDDDDVAAPVDEGRAARREAALAVFEASQIGMASVTDTLMVFDQDLAPEVHRLVAGMVAPSSVSRAAYRLPSAELARAPWWDPLTGRATGEVPADAPAGGVPILLPVRADTPSLLLAGTWRRVLGSVDVQIATGAVTAVPVPDEMFDGVALLARPVGPATGGAAGARRVEVDLHAATLREITPTPANAHLEKSGKPEKQDLTLDGTSMTVARARLLVGAGAEAWLRHEGADAVVEVWRQE